MSVLRHVIWASSLLVCSCNSIRQTVYLEHRIFVRVPGKVPPEGKVFSANEWNFRHVLQGPHQKQPEAQWYVAWHDRGRDKALRGGLLPDWDGTLSLAPEIADAAFECLDAWPQMIEPGLIYKDDRDLKRHPRIEAPAAAGGGKAPELRISQGPSSVWPAGPLAADGSYDPLWYQGASYSQLQQSREAVQNKRRGSSGPRIRIGFLDTGYDRRQAGLPEHLLEEKGMDAVQALRPEHDLRSAEAKAWSPGQTIDTGHATGTLGILAGRKITVLESDGRNGMPRVRRRTAELGGAPDAEVVPVRIAPWVASISTANLPFAIDYASRVQNCDVISMSHGGSPSMMWVDAVNAAYDRGTAIFAATGDFIGVPLPWINRFGLGSPSGTVYPAAFRRAVGVAGVTAAGESYGKLDPHTAYPHLVGRDRGDLFMHGSYGADGVRRSILGGYLADERHRTDIVQVNRGNRLRANPVSAYAPAIPWLGSGPSAADASGTLTLSLDGGGTSAATPQAAAAAANWLAYHRTEIEAAGGWNNWRKAESVYLAMIHTANRPWGRGKPDDQEPDPMLGAGTLKAHDMLKVSYNQAMGLSGSTLTSPDKVRKPGGQKPDFYPSSGGAPRDFYDADRSFYALFFSANPNHINPESIKESADIKMGTTYLRPEDRQAAMRDLYFNMLLLQQFQLGREPLKPGTPHPNFRYLFGGGPQGDDLERRAERLADGVKARSFHSSAARR